MMMMMMDNTKIGGVRTLKPLKRSTQNLAITLCTPKMKAIAPVAASGQMGEISLWRGF